jgi:DNA-binding transcriptional LysR family regulator
MAPGLDIDQLKTFLAIADHGGFSRAAAAVNKTQSAVSMQMKRLEDVLGRSLFAREGRQSRFTADGERLMAYARRLVALNDETVAVFTKPELAGSVRLGTPDDYADIFLPEILARFARSHPMVTVDVECFDSIVLKERVRRGEFDLAIVTFGSGAEDGEVVRREDLLWVTSARLSPHEQKVLPVVLTQPGCPWRQAAMAALDGAARPYRIAYSSPNASTMNAAVMQGLAVSAMPRICLRPGMKVLGEAEGFPPITSFGIGLIRRPGKLSPAAEALATHVKAGLASSELAAAS